MSQELSLNEYSQKDRWEPLTKELQTRFEKEWKASLKVFAYFLRRKVKKVEDVEDVMQRACLRMLRNYKNFCDRRDDIPYHGKGDIYTAWGLQYIFNESSLYANPNKLKQQKWDLSFLSTDYTYGSEGEAKTLLMFTTAKPAFSETGVVDIEKSIMKKLALEDTINLAFAKLSDKEIKFIHHIAAGCTCDEAVNLMGDWGTRTGKSVMAYIRQKTKPLSAIAY